MSQASEVLVARTKEWGKVALFHGTLALYTLTAFLARGYEFGKEDQNLYLPFVLHWVDPSLFPQDYLLTLGYARESLSWVAIAGMARSLPLEAIFLLLSVVLNYAVLLLAFRIARCFWASAEAGWVAAFLWVPAYSIPGVTCLSFDEYFTTRIIGTACGLLALYGLLRRSPKTSAFALFFGGLFHIVSILPAVVAVAAAHAVARQYRAAAFAMAAGVLPAGLILATSLGSGAKHEFLFRYAGEWLEVSRRTATEIFPQNWSLGTWSAIALVLAFFGLLASTRAFREAQEGARRMILGAASGILGAEILGIAGGLSLIVLLVQLCLPRGLHYLLFLNTVLLAGAVIPMAKHGRFGALLAMWAVLLWMTGDPAGQILACLLVIGHERASGLWPWIRERLLASRIRFLAVLLGLLAFVLLVQEAAVLANADPWFWLPSWSPMAAALAGALAVFEGLRRLVNGRGWASILLPLGFCMVLLLSPTRPVVALLMKSKEVRGWYGGRIASHVVYLAAENRKRQVEIRAAELARREVPPLATVLVPPDWMRFRVESLRSSFVTYKDGVPSEFDTGYAAEWYARMKAIRGLRWERGGWSREPSLPLTREELLDLARAYRHIRLEYVWSERPYDLPVKGRAGPFTLYALSGPAGSPSIRPGYALGRPAP